MAASPPAARSDKVFYEFDGFRVDPVRRRLVRDGEHAPLTPKAFSILLVLLENRGGVVDKEELIRRVWPDTYVTEANLTQNISSLRKALGERANEHRYVVTVPGQGYSFVADVVEIPRDQTGEFAVVNLAAATLPDAASGPVDSSPPAEASREDSAGGPGRTLVSGPSALVGSLVRIAQGRRRFLVAGLVLGFLFAVAIAGFFLLYARGKSDLEGIPAADRPRGILPASAIRPTVAVLALRNLSVDPRQDWLATALSEMLITELSTGSRVRLITGEEIARVRKNLGAAPGVDLRQVHDLLGADLAVTGSYLPLAVNGGSRIRIDLRVVRLPDGDILRTLSEVGTEEKLFDLVSRVGRRLRGSLGWAQPTLEEARATAALQPANAEATRLYAQGLDRLRSYDSQGASDLLQQAVEADTRSAVIRSALSLAWSNLGHDEQARQEAAKAVQLAAALPKADRLAIEARFHEVKRDWSKASEIYRSLWTFYPDNLEFGLRLTNSLSIAGRNSEAQAMVAALRQLPPRWRDDPRIDLVAAQIARRLDDPVEELRWATVAADKGKRQGEDPVVAEALLLQGDPLNTLGQPWEAISRFRDAQKLFTQSANHAAVARTLNRIGASMLMTSDFGGAERVYQEALGTARRLGSEELIAAQTMGLGFAAEYRGDLQRARSLAEQAHGQFVKMGEHLYETRSLFGLAEVLWELGEAKEARRDFEEVLTLARRSDNRLEEARALDGIGRALVAAGSLREAGQNQRAAFQKTRFRMFASTAEASLGQTLMLQGDLAGARQHLESALATKRRIRDRMGISQVLGQLAHLALAEANLPQARRYTAEQLTLAEQIRADLLVATALQQDGRLAIAAGELGKAQDLLSRALRTCDSRHAEWLAAGLRLDLSRLALLEGRPADAVRESSALASWFNDRGMVAYRARALALLSQGLLATGNSTRALEVGNQARSLAEDSEDLELQIEVVSSIAAVALATGESRELLDHLRKAIAAADGSGMVTAGLEARLALAAVQMQTGDAIIGRSTLETVRRNAADRGLAELARRAAALQASRRLPLG